MNTYRNKVRKNSNSQTVTVYHGSKEKFEQFNFSKIGLNGTSEGKGIYFTDNVKVAKAYAGENGYIYTVELSIDKHLILDKNILTKDEIKNMFVKLHEIDEDYLSNYCYAGESFNAMLNEAVRTTQYDNCDVDMIAGITNVIGSIEDVNKAVYEGLGYGSVVCRDAKWGDQTIYVALVNDVIEIIEVQKLNTLEGSINEQ